ncbi:MAG: hypothetical protein DRP65_00920 [Planctomycetota bacterium]|nr:MAG: hypothetical protein DRP65_00920 [Planctomycetota bacterium]
MKRKHIVQKMVCSISFSNLSLKVRTLIFTAKGVPLLTGKAQTLKRLICFIRENYVLSKAKNQRLNPVQKSWQHNGLNTFWNTDVLVKLRAKIIISKIRSKQNEN